MIKKISLILVALAMTGSLTSGYCQEATVAASNVSYSGEVVSIDLENSILKVKYLKDPAVNVYEEADLAITPEVKLLEEEETLELSDLDEGDLVTLEGIIDNSGKLKVETIRIQLEEIPVE